MKKISQIIVLAIALSVIVTSTVVITISTEMAKKSLLSEARERVSALSGKYGNEMEVNFKKYEIAVQDIKAMIESNYDAKQLYNRAYNDRYVSDLEAYAANMATTYRELLGMYIFINPDEQGGISALRYSEGERIAVNPIEDYKTYLAKDSSWDWYYKTVEAKHPIWIDPRYDEASGMTIMSRCSPVYVDDKLVAVVGMDIRFDDLQERVNGVKLYNTGYAFLLNKDQQFVVHPTYGINDTLESVGYIDMVRAMWETTGGILNTTLDGKPSYVGYVKMGNGYILTVVAPEKEVQEACSAMTAASFGVSFVAGLAAIALAVVLGVSISRPITRTVADLELMQEGDFTGSKHIAFMKRKHEAGVLARAMDAVQDAMKETVHTVSNSSDGISESVKHLEEVIGILVDQINGISSISSELAASMEETTATAVNLSTASNNMASQVSLMNEKNQEGMVSVRDISTRAEKLRQEAVEAAAVAEAQTRENEEKLKAAIEESKQVEQISALSDAIMSIADETSLLSLNASIEAARAGEAGRGFAVVADEISKLAAGSQNSARQIQEITGNVRATVENLCANANEMLNIMNTNVKSSYQKLIDTSEQYMGDADGMKALLEQLSEANAGITVEIDHVVRAFEELKRATADGAAGTEEVADNAETLATISHQVKTESEKLEQVAAVLHENMARFRV